MTLASQLVVCECKTKSKEEWHKTAGPSTVTGKYFGGEAWIVTRSLGQCNSFLDQVDMLRSAVEELAGSVDSSIDCELTPLLEEGMIFFAAFSELPTEQVLAGTRELSEQTQQRSLGAEPGSCLHSNSLYA